MDLGLQGVPAVVAGASRGLGFAIARELAREGAALAICSRDTDAVRKAARAITQETGAVVHALQADVSDPGRAHRFIEESAMALGGIQVVVTNAGGPPPGPATEFGREQWESALRLNFLSAVAMIEAALPYVSRAPWGRILAVTSTAAKQPSVKLSLSSAARAATTGFAKTLATELAAKNITVNCLMPGTILTDRIRILAGAPAEAGPGDPAFAETISEIPAGRLGMPEEFAAAAAFLCSRRASFITGAALQVDGGMIRSLF